jgi:hypothetical protein
MQEMNELMIQEMDGRMQEMDERMDDEMQGTGVC